MASMAYSPVQDVNAKATNLRTPFKEKYLVKDLKKIRDHGPGDAHFDVLFRFAGLTFDGSTVRTRKPGVSLALDCSK